MIANCLRSGWRAALAQPRLVATLWFLNALLGLVMGWGMSRWLAAAFDWSPEADRALQRFQFGLLVELTQYDRFSPTTFAGGVVLALVVIAAIANALVSAGILEVLTSADPRPLLHRFLRGAGHFFGRFVRLLVITALALVLAWVLVAALTRPIVNALGESSWERAWIAAGLFRFALLGAVVALIMAVLDVARVQVVTAPAEQRGMLRAWFRGARMTFRNVGTLAGIYVVLGACWIAIAGLGLAIVFAVTPTRWAAIWLLVLVQQAFVAARGGIRIARAGAVLEWVRSAGEETAGGKTGEETPRLKTGGYTAEAPTEPTPVP